MKATWVVVADPIGATIYTVPSGMARLRQLACLRHSAAPGKRDTCKPCQCQPRRSDGLPDTTKAQSGSFAGELALHLQDAHRDRQFDELILVAAPALLAELRGCLSQSLRDAVIAEIAKDLVGAQQELLQEQVLRVL